MPPTACASFIALQCFQCSTMQVKQQKKSSNKWTCVVCNEKQSVRKVYAQGVMAKDVRKFVQSFNMSRKFIDEEENLSAMVSDAEEVGGSCSGNMRKRRTDWSEYLDPQEEEEGDLEGVIVRKSTDLEGVIVREKSKEMFKKPKLKNRNQPTGLQRKGGGDGKELLKPLFPQRNITNRPSIAPLENTTATVNMMMANKKASKWIEYLTEEENEETTSTSMAAAEAAPISQDDRDSQMVEEEIHPDFM